MSWICGLRLISMRPAPDPLARFWVSRNTRSPELAMYSSRARSMTRGSATAFRHRIAWRRAAPPSGPRLPDPVGSRTSARSYVNCLDVLVADRLRQPLPPDAASRGLPSLISYAHSSVLAPTAWVRGDGTGHFRSSESVLGHGELVTYPDSLVVDRIHHLPHQEHALPTDRALAEARRDGRRRQRERIELRAVILDGHREPRVGQFQRHLDA